MYSIAAYSCSDVRPGSRCYQSVVAVSLIETVAAAALIVMGSIHPTLSLQSKRVMQIVGGVWLAPALVALFCVVSKNNGQSLEQRQNAIRTIWNDGRTFRTQNGLEYTVPGTAQVISFGVQPNKDGSCGAIMYRLEGSPKQIECLREFRPTA